MQKLSNDQVEFLKNAFPKNNQYNGNFFIVRTKPNKINPMFKPHHCLVGFFSTNRTMDTAGLYTISTDYYISANTFKKNKRVENQLLGFNNIVIDIDLHTKEDKYSCKLFFDYLEGKFTSEYMKEYGIPVPNYIVRTGRGFQLWYNLYQTAAKLKWMYDKVVEIICNRMDKMLSDDMRVSSFRTDRAASMNKAGLFRLPGSYNTKTKAYGSFIHVHNVRFDLTTLYEDNCENLIPGYAFKSSMKQDPKFANMIKNRLKMFEDIAPLIDKGKRDLLAFCVFNSAVQIMSVEEAFDITVTVNKKTKQPLSMIELKSYMSASFRKKYRLSNHHIKELLDLTQEDMAKYGIYESATRSYAAKMSKKDRKERNKKILRLAKKGNTLAELSVKFNMHPSAVSRVLTAHNFDPVYTRRLLRVQEIRKMNNRSASSIAKRLGVSRPTAYVLIKLADDIDALIKRKKVKYKKTFERKEIYQNNSDIKKETVNTAGSISDIKKLTEFKKMREERRKFIETVTSYFDRTAVA